MAKSILTNPFQLEPLIAQNMKDFVAHPLASTLAGIFSLAYSRNIINDLKALEAGIQHIECHYGSDLVVSMLRFTIDKGDSGNADTDAVMDTIKNMVSEEIRSDIMTLSQRFENRGEQRGMQQGMQRGMQRGMQQQAEQTALRMLRRNLPLSDIVDLTGLSAEKIEQLKRKSDS